MSDVASEAGLSPGALYTYVEGKEALFHLVVTGATAGSLPVPNPPPADTVTAVDRRLRSGIPGVAIKRAGKSAAPVDAVGELRDFLGTLYDAIADDREFLSVIERSARDIPGLAEQYYRKGRRQFIADFAAYLRRRADQGALRAVPDAAVTARYLLETVAWFAWHRHHDADSAMISDASARATVLDMAAAALTPEPSR
jgi:AcrR family transcriptional regulator